MCVNVFYAYYFSVWHNLLSPLHMLVDPDFQSRGLKLLLEPILQGVLETDVSYMMDFDHYFERVKSIGRMKVGE